MENKFRLSNVAKDYLSSFYCILDKMVKGMTEAKLNNSISDNFIIQMIPHHKAAIEMSENILKYTTNVALQDIAENIIKEQTKSIDNMQKIQCACSEMTNSDRDVCLYQKRVKQILKTMFSQMRDACANNSVNCNFLREMIPHHMGAVRMSCNAFQYDICQELKPVLKSIIISQKKGISQMQHLLHVLNC